MNDKLIKRMDEPIRRRDAIEAIRRERNINALMDIPAVEPKQGEWELVPYTYVRCFRCSCCGIKTFQEYWNFCPNCGAQMKGVDD